MESPTEADEFPRQRFQPGRLWSVLAMLKHYARDFLVIGEKLQEIDWELALDDTAIFAVVVPEGEDPPEPPPRKVSARVSSALTEIAEACRKLEMTVSAKLICDSIVANQPTTGGEYQLLKRALYAELDSKLLFYCPADRVGFFDSDDILSADARQAFSTAYAELREAGSCFALGRFTGAVLHCMRAAEIGVKTMTRALGHNPPNLDQEDWHPLILKCEKVIDTVRAMPKGADKEEFLKFYSQAAAQFRHFKDGWRVQAAHTRAPFSEGEARAILTATVSFFETLASRLSENSTETEAILSRP
ncbi:hypothetical protein [Vitreimonas flagellata]|uniref:hypothetical protein n=1 Tax=Vitreimonas flagellata TaxID=2560861 RepID=UPI0010756243|nr:hypothetical protein [Vitreimonas flagellata]